MLDVYGTGDTRGEEGRRRSSTNLSWRKCVSQPIPTTKPKGLCFSFALSALLLCPSLCESLATCCMMMMMMMMYLIVWWWLARETIDFHELTTITVFSYKPHHNITGRRRWRSKLDRVINRMLLAIVQTTTRNSSLLEWVLSRLIIRL